MRKRILTFTAIATLLGKSIYKLLMLITTTKKIIHNLSQLPYAVIAITGRLNCITDVAAALIGTNHCIRAVMAMISCLHATLYYRRDYLVWYFQQCYSYTNSQTHSVIISIFLPLWGYLMTVFKHPWVATHVVIPGWIGALQADVDGDNKLYMHRWQMIAFDVPIDNMDNRKIHTCSLCIILSGNYQWKQWLVSIRRDGDDENNIFFIYSFAESSLRIFTMNIYY